MTKLKQSSRIDFKSSSCVSCQIVHIMINAGKLWQTESNWQVASGKLFIHFPGYAAGGVSAQEWIFCFNYCIDIPSCGETAL